MLAQLDAALAHELARRALERAGDAAARLDHGIRAGQAAEALARMAACAGAGKAAATKAGDLASEATSVVTAFGGSVGPEGFDPAVVDKVSGPALVDLISGLEQAKNALAAAQIKAEALFAAHQRLEQARAGVPKDKLGNGVGTQIGLARHESAHRGRQLAELATIVVRELPHTMDAMTAGIIGEDRARVIAAETVFLSAEHRAEVDSLISGDQEKLAGMGSRELATASRSAAYRLDPEAFVKRRDKAVTDRYVSLRPAADGMTLLTALIPLRHGVTIINTLTQVADSAVAASDGRGRGQLMADALIHRLTQHAPCDKGAGTTGDHRGPDLGHATAGPVGAGDATSLVAGGKTSKMGSAGDSGQSDVARPRNPGLCTIVAEPDIMIELVMTDRALFDGANDPAIIVGYEPIPAPEARAMVLGLGLGLGLGPDLGPEPGSPRLEPRGPAAGSEGGSASGGSGSTGQSQTVEKPGRSGFSPRLWLRRLFTHPDSGALLTMDSRSRIFPDGMKEFLRIQYQRCANPYCGAPIRHYDHIKSWAAGGATSIANGRGLCAACNQERESPGWSAEPGGAPPSRLRPPAGETNVVGTDGPGLPRTVTTTPTGHHYAAVAPPLPGSTLRRQRRRR
ncbi:HNH endonuclease [Arthrobacter wenxiniae]|uniref:DUF222 domain-containing protein n=1 Tax=Arthrobacter wenxiniae TaxID=2713570 RepID=A0A7Y7LYJ5_9MICC|nr:DUF222 domain-containing protein [Arthrobacter wenxiniae]